MPPSKAKRKPAKTKQPVLLSGGNPQIAKGDGDAPVKAYIAAMPGWKRAVGRRLDALIVRTVPGVRKAVKWNSPFYGVEGRGWFLSVHCFTRYIKVAFFRGASLRPVPPGASTHKDVRYLDIHEDDQLDDKQLASWLRQAAKLPGWMATVLICLVALGCKGVTKDECKPGPPTCDGDVRKECAGPGGRDNIFGVHYYSTRDCTQQGERCVEHGGDAECAIDDVPCDAATHAPTLTPTSGSDFDLVECTISIGGAMYRTRRSVTACDPARFVKSCDGTSCATMCRPVTELLQKQYPDALLANLRGRSVVDCVLKDCPLPAPQKQ